MMSAHLQMDGEKTSPPLINAVLNGLAVTEGVYFEGFRLETVGGMDVYVDFSYVSTESDEALAALNKGSSVKIK